MSATNAFETAFLQHLFQNAAIANVGDASGLQPSATAGSVWISLLTADPTDSGSTTNEAAYTSYARVAVARSGAAWDVDGDTASNLAAIEFPTATGGSETVTHFGVHTASSGAGNMLLSGRLEVGGTPAPLSVSNGITPSFAIGALEVTLD